MPLTLPGGRERTRHDVALQYGYPVFVWRCDQCGLVYCSADAAKAECWHGYFSWMSEYMVGPSTRAGRHLIQTGGRRTHYSADPDHRRQHCAPTVG